MSIGRIFEDLLKETIKLQDVGARMSVTTAAKNIFSFSIVNANQKSFKKINVANTDIIFLVSYEVGLNVNASATSRSKGLRMVPGS